MNICLDFDGVMNTYNGWKGEDELFEPAEGLKEFLEWGVLEGHFFSICSTREAFKIEEWLDKYNLAIYFRNPKEEGTLSVYNLKPIAHIYIDDRGLRFRGSFKEVIDNLEDKTFNFFKAWWEKE